MGNLLGGSGGGGGSPLALAMQNNGIQTLSGYGGSSGNYGKGPELQCCEPVVDPISLITTIGGIAALSLYLRQAVIDFMIKMGRRKKRSNQQDSWLTFDNIDDIVEFFISGNFYLYKKVLT